MFRVVKVPDDAAFLPEQLGTKRKFWFQNDAFVDFLFKEGRPDSGEDWSEKVASELCHLLDLPHAAYDLALWQGRRGVVCPSFVPPGGRLVHGNELLEQWVSHYPVTQFRRVRQHTLRLVLTVLGNTQAKLPIDWVPFTSIETAIDVFVGYLMLDAWIANQDRHHENWGLVVSSEATTHLAPSYDHASCLGRNETDENRMDRLTTQDTRRSMQRYVERATSAFYLSPSSKKPMSTFDAFREAGKIRPVAARAWIERLEHVSFRDVELIFDHIPSDRISAVAKSFALKMLELNGQRLRALKEVLT
jgi:hypothetical protein